MKITERREPMAREERWLRRGMAAIVLLALLLLGVTVAGVHTARGNRAQAAARTELVLDQLQAVADRLNVQADVQADVQAETERTRQQFREAIRMLLDALDVADVDPFTDGPTPD